MYRRAFLIALACAAGAISLFLLYVKQFERESSGGEPVRVLVTVNALERGSKVTDDALGVREIPQAYVESRAIRESDKSKILGLRVGAPLQAQQTLMWSDLSVATEERRELSTLVQPGRRAATIKFQNGAISALVRPGDSVDVIGVASKDPTNDEHRSASVLLQNVLVLAVGDSTAVDPISPRAEIKQGELTLSVTLAEAQLLAVASDRGTLSIAVRNAEDRNTADRVPEVSLKAAAADLTPREAKPRSGPTELKTTPAEPL